jgi:hypothetical protein
MCPKHCFIIDFRTQLFLQFLQLLKAHFGQFFTNFSLEISQKGSVNMCSKM